MAGQGAGRSASTSSRPVQGGASSELPVAQPHDAKQSVHQQAAAEPWRDSWHRPPPAAAPPPRAQPRDAPASRAAHWRGSERWDSSSGGSWRARVEHPPASSQTHQQPAAQPPPPPPLQHGAFVPIKSWRSCAEVAGGMAVLPPQRLEQKLLSAALQRCANVHSPQSAAADSEALGRLLQLCAPRLGEFDAQGLVVIVRTAAKLGARLPAPLLRGWAAAALRRLPEFNPQDLANSLFSIGKLGQSLPAEALPPFLRAVEAACRRMLPLELSPTLLGLAYMGCSPGLAAPTAEALLHEAARRAQQFGPQELANLAHGFSRVTERASWARCARQLWVLLDAAERLARAGEFESLEVSALVLAQATMSFYHPSALRALVRAAAAGLRRREAQHLSNILLSLGLLPHPGCQPCRLAGPLEGPGEEGPGAGAGAEAAPAHVTQEQLAGFRQELARRLRWGCSSAARPPSRLDLVAQNISQAVWDLAALQACTEELWAAAMGALAALSWDDRAEGLSQLWHASLLMRADGLQAELPGELAERARAAWMALHDLRTSGWQREVGELLEAAAGAAPEIEAMTADGLLCIDLAVRGLRLAVEVDGPHHFTSNRAFGRVWPLGRTMLRNRLLEARGWYVLSVPWLAWKGLAGREERLRWLAAGVEAARRGMAQHAGDRGIC